MSEDRILEDGFNGLTSAQPSLPATWYFDAEHFQREMRDIWQRQWLYVCRAEALAAPGDFRTHQVGDQDILIVRGADGEIRGFYNTCRHRGSTLCTEAAGQFDRRIVCPYHQWSYALDGRLLATGLMREVPGFDRTDHGLHEVAVADWAGCIFVNLAGKDTPSFEALHGGEFAHIASWPMADLVVGHSYEKELACNWKIFWENFNECLHCPNIHPELCELVPIYGRGIMAQRDDPEWQEHMGIDNPLLAGGLREGAKSWSMDGRAQGALPGLSDEDIASGQRYTTLLPSTFIAAHRDYVRIVRLMPLAPERTALKAEWLFDPENLKQKDLDLAQVTDFATLVMEQDGQACELNQRGLRASKFERGILMQEEYEVFLFQDWVRECLGEARLCPSPGSRASRRRPIGIPEPKHE